MDGGKEMKGVHDFKYNIFHFTGASGRLAYSLKTGGVMTPLRLAYGRWLVHFRVQQECRKGAGRGVKLMHGNRSANVGGEI